MTRQPSEPGVVWFVSPFPTFPCHSVRSSLTPLLAFGDRMEPEDEGK